MKKRNLLYPLILVILPHIYLLLQITSWLKDFKSEPSFVTETIAGIIIGIIAEIMILRYKADLTGYFLKILISLIGSAIFFVMLYETFLFGIRSEFLQWAVQFVPAVVTSVFWLITAKKLIDKFLLMMINLPNYFTIFVVNVLIRISQY